MKNNTTNLHIRDVPVNLKALYKAHCAKLGKTMKEDIEAYMRKQIEKGKK